LKPDISTDSLKLPGYKPPYRRDRVDRLGGGAVVFVKDEINYVTRLDLQVGSVECIWLEIKINNKWGLFTNTRSNRDELRSVTYVGSVIS
jgi:hypothetical protein